MSLVLKFFAKPVKKIYKEYLSAFEYHSSAFFSAPRPLLLYTAASVSRRVIPY